MNAESSRFRVAVDKKTVVVSPREQVFMGREAQEFDKLLDRLRLKNYRRFVIDLASCNYVSSEGLGVIAACWNWCHDESNGRMALVLSNDPANEVYNLFEITGLSRVIGSAIQPSLQDALNYIRKFS
jgi:anti-anti-sigma factor